MKHPEQALQASILDLIRVAYPDVFVFAIPNGGYVMEPRIVAKLKWLGLTPGVPDLELTWPGGSGFIEVKSEGGRTSPEQKAVIDILRSCGRKVEIVHSIDDLTQTLKEWQVPTRKAAA